MPSSTNVVVLPNGVKSASSIALATQVCDVIDRHIDEGRLSIAELIGVLECIKLSYYNDLWEADE